MCISTFFWLFGILEAFYLAGGIYLKANGYV
jgi:hypothetical protein